jgi:RNA polymerase sigma factor (sigma-70 family)
LSVSYEGREIGAWFISIARNQIFDHLKLSWYRLRQTTSGIIAFSSSTGGPVQDVLDGATNSELLHCVRQLNPDLQECIYLRFLQGLSVAEMAKIMDRNEGAVKALQQRAVRRLAQLLPEGLWNDAAALFNDAETQRETGFGQFVERVAANLDLDAAAADVLGAAAYRGFTERVRAKLDVSVGLRAVLAVVPPSLNRPIMTRDPAGEPSSDPVAEPAPDALLDQEIETTGPDAADAGARGWSAGDGASRGDAADS